MEAKRKTILKMLLGFPIRGRQALSSKAAIHSTDGIVCFLNRKVGSLRKIFVTRLLIYWRSRLPILIRT
jgi:hypothetical protein